MRPELKRGIQILRSVSAGVQQLASAPGEHDQLTDIHLHIPGLQYPIQEELAIRERFTSSLYPCTEVRRVRYVGQVEMPRYSSRQRKVCALWDQLRLTGS